MEFYFNLNLVDGEIEVVIDNVTTLTVYKEKDSIDFSELSALDSDVLEAKIKQILRILFSLENEDI